jgi:ribosomal protein S18 acetylase RimI-like enzyme
MPLGMNEEVSIQLLEPTDRAAAHALLCAFKEESQAKSPVFDALRPDYREVLAAYVDEYLERKDCAIFGARMGQNLVGIVMGTIWNYLPIYAIRRMGYIPELYVERNCRGRGIGSSLVRSMHRWFCDQGVDFARIETIAAYDRNQALYERLGYQVFLVELRRQIQ